MRSSVEATLTAATGSPSALRTAMPTASTPRVAWLPMTDQPRWRVAFTSRAMRSGVMPPYCSSTGALAAIAACTSASGRAASRARPAAPTPSGWRVPTWITRICTGCVPTWRAMQCDAAPSRTMAKAASAQPALTRSSTGCSRTAMLGWPALAAVAASRWPAA